MKVKLHCVMCMGTNQVQELEFYAPVLSYLRAHFGLPDSVPPPRRGLCARCDGLQVEDDKAVLRAVLRNVGMAMLLKAGFDRASSRPRALALEAEDYIRWWKEHGGADAGVPG